MFEIRETANGRYRIGCVNFDDYSNLPQDITCSIHWATFATAQDAFAQASQWWFKICDEKELAGQIAQEQAEICDAKF